MTVGKLGFVTHQATGHVAAWGDEGLFLFSPFRGYACFLAKERALAIYILEDLNEKRYVSNTADAQGPWRFKGKAYAFNGEEEYVDEEMYYMENS
jgi:hypothetical protein